MEFGEMMGSGKSLYTRDIRHKRLPGINGYRGEHLPCAQEAEDKQVPASYF